MHLTEVLQWYTGDVRKEQKGSQTVKAFHQSSHHFIAAESITKYAKVDTFEGEWPQTFQ